MLKICLFFRSSFWCNLAGRRTGHMVQYSRKIYFLPIFEQGAAKISSPFRKCAKFCSIVINVKLFCMEERNTHFLKSGPRLSLCRYARTYRASRLVQLTILFFSYRICSVDQDRTLSNLKMAQGATPYDSISITIFWYILYLLHDHRIDIEYPTFGIE